MSQEFNKNKDNKNNSEEMDLLALFSIIGSYFSSIINFIKKIFNSLFSVILILLKVLFKFYIRIAIFLIVIFTSLTFYNKYRKVIYFSDLLITQNYKSGDLLYTSIDRLNNHCISGSYEALSNELNLDLDKAISLKGFKISHKIQESDMVIFYNNYSNSQGDTLDVLPFKEFKEMFNYQNSPVQNIRVYATNDKVFNFLKKGIVENVSSNDYFIKERDNLISTLTSKLSVYKSVINESKTLSSKYVNILENSISSNKSESIDVNLNLKGNNRSDLPLTREFELFNSSEKIKLKITGIEDSIRMKQDILRVQSGFTSSGVEKDFLKDGIYKILLYSFIFIILLLAFIEIGFFSFLKNYEINKLKNNN